MFLQANCLLPKFAKFSSRIFPVLQYSSKAAGSNNILLATMPYEYVTLIHVSCPSFLWGLTFSSNADVSVHLSLLSLRPIYSVTHCFDSARFCPQATFTLVIRNLKKSAGRNRFRKSLIEIPKEL